MAVIKRSVQFELRGKWCSLSVMLLCFLLWYRNWDYCVENWSFTESLLTQRIFLILYNTVVTRCIARLNIQKLCILPTDCIYVLRIVLTINSDCFPKQY
jgi:hypothetical protein